MLPGLFHDLGAEACGGRQAHEHVPWQPVLWTRVYFLFSKAYVVGGG